MKEIKCNVFHKHVDTLQSINVLNDFNESYFLEDDDDNGSDDHAISCDNNDPDGTAEQKRQHLINLIFS